MPIGTGNISLQDVTTEIYGDVNSGRTLQQCFTDAVGRFNPNFEANGDRLSEFRGFPFVPIDCGQNFEFNGGDSYPNYMEVELDNNSGQSTTYYEMYNIPDRLIIEWNNTVVVDTGYRGSPNYDFGGIYRSSFNFDLAGKVDPINGLTYPNTQEYPEDGYPTLEGLGEGNALWQKTQATPSIAKVYVYAPMGGTAWEIYSVTCPEPNPPTGLIASQVQETTFRLSWTDGANSGDVVGYNVYKNSSLYSDVGDVLLVDITGQTASATNSWTVRAYFSDGTLSGASEPISVTQAQASTTVYSIVMSSTGRTSSNGACGDAAGTTRYSTGQGSPSDGDVIYTSPQATNTFNGAGKFFKYGSNFSAQTFTVSSSGVVAVQDLCPNGGGGFQ